MRDDRVLFDIIERIGVINKTPYGWTRELNIVAWNGGEPKYDIREWDLSHERMSRGITLKQAEMETLVGLFQSHQTPVENSGK